MRVKNETPYQVATVVTSRHPPKPEAVVVVKGTFRLAHGAELEALSKPDEIAILSGDTFLDADDLEQAACKQPSDFGESKLNAEVMLVGSAFAPGGKPVSELGVKIELGAWSKSLRVIGRRVWTEGLVKLVSDPVPFSEMALGYENAFGGPGFEPNPAGKGISSGELPTVETATEPLRSRSDRPSPGSFGPTSPFWKARQKKLGKEYGASWLKERAPFRAADFDWSYFHSAPQDQQLRGYLNGDEPLALHNLHREHAQLRCRLPGRRVRVFVEDDRGDRREVPLVLDTLVIDSDRATVALTWRGLTPVREDDRSDLAFLLLVEEPLAEPKRPDSSYFEALARFAADPIGIKDSVPEELRAAFFGGAAAGQGDGEGGAVALLERKLGKDFKGKAEIVDALEKAKADPKVAAAIEERLREAEAKIADTPPTPTVNKPGTFPELHLRRQMRGVLAQAEKLREAIAEQRVPAAAAEKVAEKIAELEQIPHHPKLVRIDPEYTPPLEPISTEEPGPRRNLAEQDLTGRDLSGMDLSGADLTQAILTRANLTGAKLRGAKLRGATLFKTDLSGADLTDADLTRANAARANFEGATLERATIEQTFFEHAKLTGAKLTRAKGSYAMFIKAELEGATLREASLPYADFSAARAHACDLRRSDLQRAALNGANFSSANLSDAKLSRAGLRGADLSGAKLVGVRADHAVLEESKLDGADASFGVFTAVHFTRCSAAGAKFFGANLRDARLTRANLSDASFERANLMGAELSKARVDRASFRGASLYDAKLLGTSGKDADFMDAVLHRSTLERA